MSTFGNEIENDLADKKNNTKKKVLIAVNLVTDGLGDVYHLFDIIQHEKEFMANYEKDVLLTTNYELQKQKFFIGRIKSYGFKIIFVDSPQEIESGNLKSKNFFILENPNNFVKKGDNKKNLVQILEKNYVGILDVSDIPLPYVSIKLPRISINEHGKRGTIINAQHEIRSMDLSKDTCSIFLSEENREKPGKQLAEILSQKENSHVLSGLLGSNAKANIEEECNKLLSDNLFVPMYLQHNDGAIINFINVVTNSKLSRQYKSTIFFVNKEGVNVNYLEWAASNGLLSKEIGKIIIKTQGGEREILHRNAYSNAKKIKLLVGYRIDDDHDYKNIFHCAQYFAGCSGDKTLESVLSNGLIPLFIPHNDSKISFIENASQVSELFKFLVVLDAASNSYDNAIEPCVPGTKGEYDDLFDDDERLSQEDLAELKKDAQNYLQNLGKDFDQNFFEDWKKMCIDLRVNYNLHDKLPEIIDGFFRKNGLEVTENKGEKKEILTNYEKHIRDQKDNNNSENAPKTLGIHKTQF